MANGSFIVSQPMSRSRVETVSYPRGLISDWMNVIDLHKTGISTIGIVKNSKTAVGINQRDKYIERTSS